MAYFPTFPCGWRSLLVVTILGLSSSRIPSTTEALSIQSPLTSTSRQHSILKTSTASSPRQEWKHRRAFPASPFLSPSSSTSTRTALFQSAIPAPETSQKSNSSTNGSKPRFVIEKIGGGGGGKRGVGASSHASYYYGDYVNDKVYREISNLCVQSFFGTTTGEIQQHVQSSTQKAQLYESLQPEELRRRKDDVKTASEFFVAYELKEATPEDMEQYRREQELQQQQRMQQERERRRVGSRSPQQQRQMHYNGNSNDYYYTVDHQVKSPAKMASGYEPDSNRRRDTHDDDDGPVVMGGTLGGVAGRRRARQQAKNAAQRPLKRYRQHDQRQQQQSSSRRSRWKQVQANENHVSGPRGARGDPRARGGRDVFNDRRGYVSGDYDEFDYAFYNPYTMEEVDPPMVMGGKLGNAAPGGRRRQRRMSRRGAGPLFAHRPYREYQQDFDHYQKPHSTQRSWGVEQPFMVENQSTRQYGAQNQRQPKKQRHSQPPMPHEAKTAHKYSSSDEINFEYHYDPNLQESNVRQEGLPIDDSYPQQRRPKQANSVGYEQQPPQQFYRDPMGGSVEETANHYAHAQSTGDVFEKEAPMYVKGPIVGFVEIVHAPYSLGVLDDPEMLTAGMKPHRPVLRNLVVAKHAQNSGIGTRLLEACERHVQTHWQMKELVVEVDDWWDEAGKASVSSPKNDNNEGKSASTLEGATTPSAVEFYLSQGYEVVFSDPESNRYDEETGEIIGQIQCRRDVMRKVFDKKEQQSSGGSSSSSSTSASASSGAVDKAKTPADVAATALDVEYIQSTIDEVEESSTTTTATFKEDIHDCGSAAIEAELITDPSQGPRTASEKAGSTVSCDPEGPNQSIFNYSSTDFE